MWRYTEFPEETRLFLNKAMDIYFTIKEKDLDVDVDDVFFNGDYRYTRLDKKILSFFIAGFLVDGSLNEILSDYDYVYSLIAEQAYLLNMGARGLQIVINSIRTQLISEVYRGTNDTIQLNAELVTRVIEQTMSRKRRI